jgi:hypothetical protein
MDDSTRTQQGSESSSRITGQTPVRRTRFCAEPGGCDDPTCYLCTVVPVKFPVQPPTLKELNLRTTKGTVGQEAGEAIDDLPGLDRQRPSKRTAEEW